MGSTLLASALAAALVSGPAAKDVSPGPAPQSEIQAVLSCIAANTCSEPAEKRVLKSGKTLHVVTVYGFNDDAIQYYYSEQPGKGMNGFGVTFATDGVFTYLSDANRDGKVDAVSSTSLKSDEDSIRQLSEKDQEYEEYQTLYLQLLNLAQDVLLSPPSSDVLGLPVA